MRCPPISWCDMRTKSPPHSTAPISPPLGWVSSVGGRETGRRGRGRWIRCTCQPVTGVTKKGKGVTNQRGHMSQGSQAKVTCHRAVDQVHLPACHRGHKKGKVSQIKRSHVTRVTGKGHMSQDGCKGTGGSNNKSAQ